MMLSRANQGHANRFTKEVSLLSEETRMMCTSHERWAIGIPRRIQRAGELCQRCILRVTSHTQIDRLHITDPFDNTLSRCGEIFPPISHVCRKLVTILHWWNLASLMIPKPHDQNVQRDLYLVTNSDSRIMNSTPSFVFKLHRHGNRYIWRIILTVYLCNYGRGMVHLAHYSKYV